MYNLPREINEIEIQILSHKICSKYEAQVKKNSQNRDKTTCSLL